MRSSVALGRPSSSAFAPTCAASGCGLLPNRSLQALRIATTAKMATITIVTDVSTRIVDERRFRSSATEP